MSVDKKSKALAIAIIVIIAIILLISLIIASKNSNQQVPGDAVIFQNSESWGPCPDTACQQETTLYKNGTLFMEGAVKKEIQIPPEKVEEIISKIVETGLLTKDCHAPIIMDYWATYTVSDGHISRQITFPGCDNDIGIIDGLLNTYTNP